METFDDEEFILKNYRLIPSIKIKYFGRLFHCLWVERLTKSILFSKSWVNSSAKNELPPDFHNDKHHIMMEFMRIDDCVNMIKGRHISNSFERINKFMRKYLGNGYKKKIDGRLYFVPDTTDSKEFNYSGYVKNFERVLLKHSEKIDSYHKNYPSCKTSVLFVCDESNNYIQVTDKNDLNRENEKDLYLTFRIHYCYYDKKFIDIIKKCKADYVIWFGCYKSINVNNKEQKYPRACIYDVKHFKQNGYEYNDDLIMKIKEEV